MAADAPKPGTYDAVQLGCTCPVSDNHHGAGRYGRPDTYFVNMLCPVHGRSRCAACPIECGVCDVDAHCPKHCLKEGH